MGLLRFLLAISVYAEHTEPLFGLTFVGGTMAVQSFYMISGFYMALILCEKYTGKNRYRLFIFNRFLRLYPTFAVISLLVILSAYLNHTSPFHAWSLYHATMSLGTMLFVALSQALLVGQDLLMFCRMDPVTGTLAFAATLTKDVQCNEFLVNRTAWTIGVEMWFYLLAPFLVRYRTRTLWLIIAGSLLLRFIIYIPLDLWIDPWTYRFFPNELSFFLFGVLGYRLYLILKERKWSIWYGRIAWAAVILLTIFLGSHPKNAEPFMLIYYPIIALSLPFIFYATKRWQTDRFIGDLSYPIYLSHLFFFEFDHLVWKSFNHVELLVITLAFSWAAVVLIEKPIDQWRQRLVARSTEITAP